VGEVHRCPGAARDQAIADVLLSLSIVCHPAAGVGSFEFQTTTGPLAQDYLQALYRDCENVPTLMVLPMLGFTTA